MKKLILTAVLLAAVLALAGCDRNNGGQSPSQDEYAGDSAPIATAAPATAPSANLPFNVPADGFAFEHNGVLVGMGAMVTETLDLPAFGEPLSIRLEPSCAFEGNDLSYIFSDFVVEAFSYSGIYYVRMVNFRNDNVSTMEGLRIGMSRDEMLDIYGEPDSVQQGMYSFERDGSRLDIFIDNSEVVQITYYLDL